MTAIKITFHEKLNAVQCICGFTGTSHECKEEKFAEKLSLSIVLKKIVTCVKIRSIEMNIMS